jgi:hypothetical protein
VSSAQESVLQSNRRQLEASISALVSPFLPAQKSYSRPPWRRWTPPRHRQRPTPDGQCAGTLPTMPHYSADRIRVVLRSSFAGDSAVVGIERASRRKAVHTLPSDCRGDPSRLDLVELLKTRTGLTRLVAARAALSAANQQTEEHTGDTDPQHWATRTRRYHSPS